METTSNLYLKLSRALLPAMLAGLLVMLSTSSNHMVMAQSGQSLLFIENVGQFETATRFQVYGEQTTLSLTEEALWLTIIEQSQTPPDKPTNVLTAASPDQGVNLRLSFVNANPQPRLEPFNRLNTRVSYFTGKDPAGWQVAVPVWGGVRYVDLYPGIDLEITGENGRLVQRLIVQEDQSEVSAQSFTEIALRVEGARALAFNNGQLRLNTAMGEFILPLLQVEPAEMQIASTFQTPRIEGEVILSPFATISSVVDSPVQIAATSDLRFSTFLGGSGNMDSARSIAINGAGQTFVVGQAYAGFPTTPGSFDTSIEGVEGDAFVVKLNTDGSGLEYATFLGGSDFDISWDIALDETEQAYVVGFTKSTDFPTTPDVVDTEYGGQSEVFVVKLNATGTNLVYATLLGGIEAELATGIAIDAAGDVYITGFTESPDFPTSPDAYDTELDFWYDIFVAKLNTDATALLYSTLVGGNNADYTWGLAVDSAGSAYVTGYTHSTDFPVTPGAHDTSYDGQEVLVVKVNPDGTDLAYATFLGGAEGEYATSIVVDESGSAYLTGTTRSTDFPVTAGAYDTTFNTTAQYSGDGFVAKLTPDGSDVAYATYLGGSNDDVGEDIALDESGNIYVTGNTTSPDFPTTIDAFDPICEDCTDTFPPPDVFAARLSADGSTLAYATFLGGNGYDRSEGIAVDASGNAYLTGDTSSVNFPITFGAFDSSKEGFNDAFVAKLNMTGGGSVPTPVPSHTCSPAALGEITVGDSPRGIAVDSTRQRVYVANFGSSSVSVIDSQTNTVIDSLTGITAANGVAHDQLHNVLWVTNYTSNQVTPIQINANATEFTVLPAIDVGVGPWGVVYSLTYGQVYIANSLDDSVTVIDAASQTVATTLDRNFSRPFHLANSPVTGKTYVANHGNNSVTVIAGNTVSKVVDLYDSARPYGLTVDEQRSIVYVATVATNRIVAIGAINGEPDRFLGWAAFYRGFGNRNRPVPLRVIAVNPDIGHFGDGGHLWSTTATADGSESNQTLLIPKGWTSYFHYPLAQNVDENPGEGIAIDRITDRVYVSSGTSPGTVSVFGDHGTLCSYVGPASAPKVNPEFDFDIFVRVTLASGDVTGDGIVDIFDLAFIATRFDSTDPAADINHDGRVNILDLATVAGNYGLVVTPAN